MAKVYAFCNQKGGVGKTTSSVNLSAAIALRGLRVLLIDLDPQGNTTSGFGVDRKSLSRSVYEVVINESSLREVIVPSGVNGLDLAPSSVDLAGAEIELIDAVGREFVLKGAIKALTSIDTDRYDYIFIDCPPSLGILSLNAMVAAHKLLIPLQCEYYALEGLGQLLNTFKLVRDRLNPELEIGGVILTMADFRTKLTGEVIQEVRKHFGEKVFASIIPRSVKLSEAPSFGKPAILYDTANRGSQGYLQLAEEFIKNEAQKIETVANSELSTTEQNKAVN